MRTVNIWCSAGPRRTHTTRPSHNSIWSAISAGSCSSSSQVMYSGRSGSSILGRDMKPSWAETGSPTWDGTTGWLPVVPRVAPYSASFTFVIDSTSSRRSSSSSVSFSPISPRSMTVWRIVFFSFNASFATAAASS